MYKLLKMFNTTNYLTHTGYEKHSQLGDNSGNSRNSYGKKTVKTRFGKSKIDIPRDRNGDFEPQIVKKYETTSNQFGRSNYCYVCERSIYKGY